MLIALCGKAGSGKSTLAEMFQKETGYEIYSMARPIKEFFSSLFLWDTEHLFGYLKEQTVKTPFVSMNDILAARADAKILLDSHQFVIQFQKVFAEYALDSDLFDGYPATQYAISPRKAMQIFGTEVCRGLVEGIWVECATEAYRRSGGNLIIDDIRFENELEMVSRIGGVLVGLTGRGGHVGTTHASESFDAVSLSSIQYDNSKSLKEAVAFVKKVCNDSLVIADKDAQAAAHLLG